MTEKELNEYITMVNQILKSQETLIAGLRKEIDDQKKIILYQNQQINTLINNNWVFIKKNFKYINKAQLDYQMTLPFSGGEHNAIKKHKLIVSLTSFPARMYELKYTIFSLLTQTVQADEIVLWLANDEFPHREEDISRELLLWLKEHGVTIRWCDNLYSYKKQIFAFREYPDDIIITADDDVYYLSNWLELLYMDYLEHHSICSHRAHKVLVKDGAILPYNEWGEAEEDSESYCNFFTGVGGILYPPHSLYKDVLCEELFTKICPKQDDVWLWGMAVLNDQKIRVVPSKISDMTCVNLERELGISGEATLCASNVGNCENDKAISDLLQRYPGILERICGE